MNIKEIFYILGIEPTKDEKLIKSAYRQKLVITNPEDNPEGFKELRMAYEEACSYAKKDEEESENTEEDNSVAGQWLIKAKELYENINYRKDAAKWEALFEEDVFVSLEGFEECRNRLLTYMMDHFRFPNCTWHVIAENLRISDDSQKFRENFPGGFVEFLINRCFRAEEISYELFEGEPNADYDAYLQNYSDAWNLCSQEDYDKAQEIIDRSKSLLIYHPYMEFIQAQIYCGRKEITKAQELLESVFEKYPEDETTIYQLAQFYMTHEMKDNAFELFEKLKENNENHYMANYQLAYLYYDRKEFKKSKECVKKVLRRGDREEMVEFGKKVNIEIEKELKQVWEKEKKFEDAKELIWCYLQDDKGVTAGEFASELKEFLKEDDANEYESILCRIAYHQHEYLEAVEHALNWIPKDEKDEDIKLSILFSCYQMLGRKDESYVDKAKECADRLLEMNEEDKNRKIELLIQVSRCYLEGGKYSESIDISEEILAKYNVQYAYCLLMEAHAGLWNAAGVVDNAIECIRRFPEYSRSYDVLAKVYFDLKYEDRLEELLNVAGENNIDTPFLKFCVERKGDQPNEITHVIIGDSFFDKRDYDSATRMYSMALEYNPACAEAYRGKGRVLRYKGELEAAIRMYNLALLYVKSPDSFFAKDMCSEAADILFTLGKYEDSIKYYDWYEEKLPGRYFFAEERIYALIRAGKKEEALAYAESITDRDKKEETLYNYYMNTADYENAEKMMDLIEKNPSTKTSKYTIFTFRAFKAMYDNNKAANYDIMQKYYDYLMHSNSRVSAKINWYTRQLIYLDMYLKELYAQNKNNCFDAKIETVEKELRRCLKYLSNTLNDEVHIKNSSKVVVSTAIRDFSKSNFLGKYESEGPYAEFILALYGLDDEAISKYYEKLMETPDCVECGDTYCEKKVIASVLYAIKQGDLKKAEEICKETLAKDRGTSMLRLILKTIKSGE